jgi:redox-sensitive bicupin YhaK (pirin superfamily)
MRTIKKIHPAQYHPIADLTTYSPLPSQALPHLDPFLFLNHHGHQEYPPNNQGLPFGPHPHRGMETVTFILEGDIMHQDSQGYQSVIQAGGIQWMTAGSGLLHAETSSAAFKKNGGDLEILQLWLNLPARLKMTAPQYVGKQAHEIPTVKLNDHASLQLVAGNWQGQGGAVQPLTDVFLSVLEIEAGGEWIAEVPAEHNIFCYVVRGKLNINQQTIPYRNLVEFQQVEGEVQFQAVEKSLLIWGHALPFQEPIVAQGPFVMNSEAEIMQAYLDYQTGKLGTWR